MMGFPPQEQIFLEVNLIKYFLGLLSLSRLITTHETPPTYRWGGE